MMQCTHNKCYGHVVRNDKTNRMKRFVSYEALNIFILFLLSDNWSAVVIFLHLLTFASVLFLFVTIV